MKKYIKPEIGMIPMSMSENIAASGRKTEQYDIRIRRDGEEIIVQEGGFDSLAKLIEWLTKTLGL